MKCRHCSVGAAPELHANKYSDEFADRVVREMPEIKRAGIVSIDFTGGEPTLLMGFLKKVSAAAAQHAITCGVVSAAHWATTERQATKVIDELAGIDHWDISTDIYHTEFVPLSAVERAYRKLTERGKSVMIRVAHQEPIGYDDALLIEEVMRFAGRNVSFQPIGPVGRGDELVESVPATAESYDQSQCPTTGPLIQWDGRVSPCCAPASHENHDHPLWIGSTHFLNITELIQKWRTDPLLQTIRVWGFGIIREWFQDAGVKNTHILTTRTCDTCVNLLRDPTLSQIALERASELSHRIRLAHALLEEFDEPWIDQLLRQEAEVFLRRGTWPGQSTSAA